MIISSFLREELLPKGYQSQLRKSLALVDEPDIAYKHFRILLQSLLPSEKKPEKDLTLAIRQINISLWILFSWAREAKNTESAYLASELAVLYGWEITKNFVGKKTKTAIAIHNAMNSLLRAYLGITFEYLEKNIIPHTKDLHAISSAIQGSCSLDINLKLFDLLGRLAMGGIWLHWMINNPNKEEHSNQQAHQSLDSLTDSLIQLIRNNPALFLPIKDSQVIDISLAVLILMLNNRSGEVKGWLSQIMSRTDFAHQIGAPYPCNLESYSELLNHPEKSNEYLKECTTGSVLYPMIALWATLTREDEIYSQVQALKTRFLSHCNLQFWYLDETTEKYLYTNKEIHGAALSQLCIDEPSKHFQEEAFRECEHFAYFQKLSVVKAGFWPISLVACRRYRLPLPLDLWQPLHENHTKS